METPFKVKQSMTNNDIEKSGINKIEKLIASYSLHTNAVGATYTDMHIGDCELVSHLVS